MLRTLAISAAIFLFLLTHAFLYDGTMHDLGTLGGSNSFGLGINDAGQVTGSSDPVANNGEHASLYDGTMHDLGTLVGRYSKANGINGRVVSNGAQHAIRGWHLPERA